MDKLSLICFNCENKFKNYELHNEFKEKLLQKEFEISELNQKYEKSSLVYSEQLDEINRVEESIVKKKRENEAKEEMFRNEINNLRIRADEACNMSERATIKINESITFLKSLEEKKKTREKEVKDIQRDRENITYEFEKRQTTLEEVLAKINQLSISLKNLEQKNSEREVINKETGNKQLDKLLKEKLKSQVCYLLLMEYI
jgi:hypothetical protein